MFETKKTNYINGFKLFNPNADRYKSEQSRAKRQKRKEPQTVQLHFINPNLLFLDARKPKRAATALSSYNRYQKKYDRAQTSPEGYRKQLLTSKQNRETVGRGESRATKRKLGDYIKMEGLFLSYQRSGNFTRKKI